MLVFFVYNIIQNKLSYREYGVVDSLILFSRITFGVLDAAPGLPPHSHDGNRNFILIFS